MSKRSRRLLGTVLLAASVGCGKAPMPTPDAGEMPPSCTDGARNGVETDLDCGGSSGCSPCAPGKACALASDCSSQLCQGGICLPAISCIDGLKNGPETDIDCGGSSGCSPCAPGKGCVLASDCSSQLCQGGMCLPPISCSDGIKNGAETDIDCGGSTCAPCANGKACAAGTDCQIMSCIGLVCQAPSCTDHTQNAHETDVDCGGSDCSPCADGRTCALASDCVSSVCQTTCQAPSCTDGVKNGSEIGPDCGASCQACPPDPVAPPLSRAGATSLFDSWSFLFSGAGAVQTGVDTTKLDQRRLALLRGHVRDRSGAAMPFVKVEILSRPEFGQTISRLDGGFELVVNGGEPLVVAFSRAGVISSQRRVNPRWQEALTLDDVVLVAYDGAVTKVDFSAPIQVARQNPVTDADGSRRATILFPQGTTAEMTFADGGTAAMPTVSVRATEYTVGASGPLAMPGSLPPSSAYTYAVELSADEAVAAGAVSVSFSKPVTLLLENFLNMPTGKKVPFGSYDRQRGVWLGSPDGRVIKIVSITAGLADIDADGDGAAESATDLAALGVTTDERTTLATLYTAGQTLWRMPVQHFTPWDCNWPWGPPTDVVAPPDPYPNDDDDQDNCCDDPTGSVIESQNQGLRETIPIAGTPLSLTYRSRLIALEAPKTLTLTGPSITPDIVRVELQISVGGQLTQKTFVPAPNLTYTFAWDGKDGFGRDLFGTQRVIVSVGYVYNLVYKDSDEALQASFALPGGTGVSADLVRGRKDFTLWRSRELTVRRWDMRGQGFGGWLLSNHHVFDPVAGLLARGDGRTQFGFPQGVASRSPASARPTRPGPVMVSVVYDATLPSDQPKRFALAPDGKIYWGDSRYFINTLDANGQKVRIAGTGFGADYGDNGPALSAGVRPEGLAVGPDGALYFAAPTSNRIRRVDVKAGTITTVVNVAGAQGTGGSGGPAINAQLYGPMDLAFALDGTMFIADGFSIRRVGPDGVLTIYAGGYLQGAGAKFPAGTSNVAAVDTDVEAPNSISVGPDGSVYFSESGVGARRITPDGVITTVGADLFFPQIRSDGTLIALGSGCAVYEVAPTGERRKILGGGTCLGTPVDGVPGTAANGQFLYPELGPDETVYSMPYGYPWRIRQLTSNPPLAATFFNDRNVIASSDGTALFNFANGLHSETLDPMLGIARSSFVHDTSGRLVKILDDLGLETTIQRDAAGNPTAIIAPGGQKTTLELDANGFLSKVTRPDGASFTLTASPLGLLTQLVDPAGGTHTFAYDADGRLSTDQDPAGGQKTLARVVSGATVTTTVTSKLGRVATFVTSSPDAGLTQTNTSWAGALATTSVNLDQTYLARGENGDVVGTTFAPDPRFGLAMPLVSQQTVSLPSGLTSTASATRTITTAANDPLNVTQQVDTFSVNGRIFTRSFDGSSRTVTMSTPSGLTGSLTFDDTGRLIEEDLSGLPAATSTYDARGRLKSRTRGSAVTAWTFDALDRVTSKTDAAGGVTQYAYNANDRLTRLTLPSGRQYQMAYDSGGRPAAVTMPSGTIHTLTYDSLDRLATYRVDTGGALTFSFDADRARLATTLPGGRAQTASYDTGGRFLGFTMPEATTTVAYQDQTRRVDSATYALKAGGAAQKIAFTYDGDLLTREAFTGPATGQYDFTFDANFLLVGQTFDGVTTTMTRDGDGRLQSQTSGGATYTISRDGPRRLTSQIDDGAQLVYAVTYDASGREASRSLTYGPTVRFSATYDYDAVGRLVNKAETVNGTSHAYGYTYDLDGQLTKVARDGSAFEASTYDVNGNRTQLVLSGVTETATFDAQDRITAAGGKTWSVDADGRLAARGADTFVYGTRGELLSATVGAKTITYAHDALGRRVARTDGTSTTQYFYGATSSTLTHVRRPDGTVTELIYDESSRLVAFHRGGKRYFVATDQVGTPRLVLDDTGAVVKSLDFDSYGRPLADSNPAFDLDIGFAGGIPDPVTGLVRFGWRDYDPQTARWTSRDPLLFKGRNLNLYGYARNQPVLLRDLDGRVVQKCSNPVDNIALKIFTAGQGRHYWLSALGIAGGLVGDTTVGNSSSEYGPNTICEDVDGADEICVAQHIQPGVSPTPPWRPWYTCKDFVNDVIDQCTPQSTIHSVGP